MKRAFLGVALSSVFWASGAYAAVPVKDAAILTKKSDTAATVASLAPIQEQSRTNRRGVHCSVTTGRRASIEEPMQAPDAAGATRSIRAATGGEQPVQLGRSQAGFAADSQGWNAASAIEGGIAAGQGAVTRGGQTYETLKGQIGSTGTINEAFDQNSQVRLQNATGWNNAINTANNFVQALNQLTLMRNSDVSRASTGLGGSGSNGRSGGVCPAGTRGAGTESSPCVALSSTCAGVSVSGGGASMCVTRRYTDSYGNVLVYLENVEAGLAPATGQLTPEELMQLMGQYQSQ